MKRISYILAVLLIFLLSVISVSAADSNVIYNGNAKEFIFLNGSEYSPTDLFPDFKDVMPGDSITQKITVKNDASNKVKVKIYMRSLGAHADSVDFLSKLNLRVQKAEQNKMAYMFDAAADCPAQLTDWVCLGVLYSGGEVDLDVILDVPSELDNKHSEKIGYLDWEFKIEELPIGTDDPKPPQTSDAFNAWLWSCMAIISVVGIVLIVFFKRKQK